MVCDPEYGAMRVRAELLAGKNWCVKGSGCE